MNIFKKIYIRIFGEKKKEEKQPECWYNNAHEKGEATHREMSAPTGGENGFEVSSAHSHEHPM